MSIVLVEDQYKGMSGKWRNGKYKIRKMNE